MKLHTAPMVPTPVFFFMNYNEYLMLSTLVRDHTLLFKHGVAYESLCL